MDEHDDEYLRGVEGRDHWPICEDIFERPVQEIKRRAWLAVDVGARVADAARDMVSKHIGSVLVTRQGKLAGILTERDLMNQMVEKPFDARETKVADLMTAKVVSLRLEDTVAQAIHHMSRGGYRRLPLVDGDGCPVGMVSVRDIVDYMAVLFPHKILTMPPDPAKIPEKREGG